MNFSDRKLLRLQSILGEAKETVLCLDRDGTENEGGQWTWARAKMLPVEVWRIRAKDPGEMDVGELRALKRRVR